MISDETITILRSAILISRYCMVLPVNWDNDSPCPGVTFDAGWRKYITKCITLFFLTAVSLVMLIVVRNLLRNELSTFDIIFGIFFMSILGMVNLVYLCMLCIMEDVVLLFNFLLRLNCQIGKLNRFTIYKFTRSIWGLSDHCITYKS